MLKPSSRSLSGQVRIGTTHTFNIGLIPECVALFLARHPSVKVRVEELPAEQIDRLIAAGRQAAAQDAGVTRFSKAVQRGE